MSLADEASDSRVAFSTKLLFGSGAVAEGAKTVAFNTFLLFYYNQVLGLPGVWSGFAIFLALCVDAVTDPLVGSLSDNFSSRWGRRHPFMYASALPMAVGLFLLFHPPAGLGELGLFVWLTSFAVLVRVSMTLYAIPSAAMVPELTPDYDERTSVVGYRYLFGWLGGLAVAQIGYLVCFAPSETFVDGRLDPDAYGSFAGICACIVVAAILTCATGTHRLIPSLKKAPAETRFDRHRFFEDVREVLANPSFRVLVIASLFSSTAIGFSDVVGLYMNTYFWEFTTAQIAVLVYGLVLAAILGFAAARPLSEHWDKRRTAVGLATFAILFGPIPVFSRLLGWFPPNDHPILLPLILVHTIIIAGAFVAMSILFSSMIADLVDQNELVTGKRQEGMFASTIAFTIKATSGLGGLLAGVVLDWIQFPQQASPGEVDPERIFLLGLAVGPALMTLHLVTLLCVSRYRVSRQDHEETLAELLRRRATP